MGRIQLTVPRGWPGTRAIVGVVILVVCLLVVFYFWVISTQMRPML